MRSLRELLAALRISPEERQSTCCERSLEALYDGECRTAHPLADQEQAAIEAERRRVAHGSPAMSGTNRTSS
ncbi:MAG: hypothetical protein M3P44_00180 [Actinomycetota bacterium]|nr:hypothetical protein [Actinomycetota bacterium]